MRREDVSVGVAELVHETRRPFDVGEHEGDEAGWKVGGRHATSVPWE